METTWNNYKTPPNKSGLILVMVGKTLSPYIAFYKPSKGYEVWGAGREVITDMKVVAWAEIPSVGPCVRCKKHEAVIDYNGCFYAVCGPCYETLEKEFEEDYR